MQPDDDEHLPAFLSLLPLLDFIAPPDSVRDSWLALPPLSQSSRPLHRLLLLRLHLFLLLARASLACTRHRLAQTQQEMPVDTSGHSLAILDDWEGAAEKYADWTPLASLPRTIYRDPIPRADLAKTLEPYTILHAMRERTKIDRALLDSLPNLRFIATTGHRNRGIDVAAARERGIVVSGTLRGGTEGSSGAVEQTWALLLALARRIPQEHASMRQGGWISGVATGLADKTLGLVGVGRLGKQVAAIAKAFGMRVVAWSPHLTQARADEAGVELAPSLDDLLSTSHFVSLHLVHSASTTGIIGRRELELLKPSAYLVNTSRGPLVDEQALVDTLRAKRFAGAGLDVFDQEPLPRDHRLRTLDNVVLSPHMGARTFFHPLALSMLTSAGAGYVEDSAFEAWWPQSVANIEAFLRGSPVRVLES